MSKFLSVLRACYSDLCSLNLPSANQILMVWEFCAEAIGSRYGACLGVWNFNLNFNLKTDLHTDAQLTGTQLESTLMVKTF